MFGDCSELPVGEVFGVLRGGIVKVDCPCGRDKGIGKIFFLLDILLLQRGQRLGSAAASLQALSPLATLGRGYSITRRLTGKEVVTDAGILKPGEELETLLAEGRLVSGTGITASMSCSGLSRIIFPASFDPIRRRDW